MNIPDEAFDELDPSDKSRDLAEQLSGITVWKILLVLLIGLVGLLLTASIVCGTNDTCRNHIPTLQNMLNSHLASPFVTTSINIMQLIHLVLAMATFYMCKVKAPYWSSLQLVVATLFHVALLLTLFLVTFLGWDRNWANVGAIVVWMAWMLLVMKCLKKYHKYRIRRIETSLLKFNWMALLFFFLSTIIYIVFRALSPNQLDFKGKDSAVLVAEIVGGVSAVGFIVLLLFHTRKVTFNMHAPK